MPGEPRLMPTYSYFPGCALHKSAQEYDQSARLVCRARGIELKELPDWSCCGASPAHHTQAVLAAALAARNLVLAAKERLPLLAPCPACFGRLKATARELETDPQLVEQLQKEFGLSLQQQVEVVFLLEAINQLGPEKIKQLVKRDLSALKVAPYYGCLLVRPKEVAIDDLENPTSLDKFLETIGVQVMPWEAKVTCCGATMGIGDKNLIVKLSGDILERAHLAGAHAVVVLCPLCHGNLDLRQSQIRAGRNGISPLPVFYFTQLLGLAFGFSPKQVGLDKNIVDPMPLVKSFLTTDKHR